MARGFVDHLDVQPGTRGSRIHLRHRVLRPAALLTGDPHGGRTRSVTSELLDVRRRGRDVVEVSGAVAPASADRMGLEICRAVTTGSDTPLKVDLTDVTVLCSGGVQVLLDTVRSPGRPQDAVVLYAAPGSPAQHVLDLVQVPYEPRRPSS
jgi:hypothetical protein